MEISFRISREKRAAVVENPKVPLSSANILSFLGLDSLSAAGEAVTIDTALEVPAIWAAVNFLSSTIATLPLDLYRRTQGGRRRVEDNLARILHDAPNDETSSYDWRKYMYEQVFTAGRGISFIERNAMGRVINIWPLDVNNLKITRVGGRTVYEYKDGRRTLRYKSDEIIDIPFMLKSDRLSHRSPIYANKASIGLALAVTRYGSKYFENGGVPPFAVEGPFQSQGAIQRASEDLSETIKRAAKEKRLALTLPTGHTIKSIGADPEKSQMIELQRFMIEQCARIYQMPPTFLQDLTHGTFSNTEQEDLRLVKHVITRHVIQFEQQLNLKLFGRFNNSQYAEFNLDGILRGDFQTRMAGFVAAVQGSLMKPNEARRKLNLPDDENGDVLMVQGATVPLGQQVKPIANHKENGVGEDNG